MDKQGDSEPFFGPFPQLSLIYIPFGSLHSRGAGLARGTSIRDKTLYCEIVSLGCPVVILHHASPLLAVLVQEEFSDADSCDGAVAKLATGCTGDVLAVEEKASHPVAVMLFLP